MILFGRVLQIIFEQFLVLILNYLECILELLFDLKLLLLEAFRLLT